MRLKTIEDLHLVQNKINKRISEIDGMEKIMNYEWSLLSKSGKALALIYSNFKCETCEKETDLTLHHLINRINKDYIDIRKYAIQRHLWSNLSILCKDCHYSINYLEDGDKIKPLNEMKSISDKTINFAKVIVMNSLKEKEEIMEVKECQ